MECSTTLFKFVSIGHRSVDCIVFQGIMKYNVRSLDVSSIAYQGSNYGDFQPRKVICLQRM